MSLRLEMLQVARLAPRVLDEAADLVCEFVRGQERDDGGYPDRDGKSDLYYTSFAVDALTALQDPLPERRLAGFLRGFGDGDGLDFVHLCCLIRLWSVLREERPEPAQLERMFKHLERFRSDDGGFEVDAEADEGSAYGCLLAYGAHADHGREVERLEALADCLDRLRAEGGGWANDSMIPIGSVPATAAAVTVSRNLRHPVPEGTGDWLMAQFHPQGGFVAVPGAPMPDLLSTAVALHALDGLQADFEVLKEPCLDFIDSLWTNAGGFHGNWSDDELDLEYTYYGLLALGHLAL